MISILIYRIYRNCYIKFKKYVWIIWNKKTKNTNFSDSPSHFETKSDEDTEKNVELPASVATAFAK